MESRYQKQIEYKKKIDVVFENYVKLASNKKNRGKVQSYLDHLEAIYEKFLSNDEAINNIPDVDRKHIYFLSNMADVVENEYYNQKGDLNQVLYEFDRAEALEEAQTGVRAVTPAVPTQISTTQTALDALLASLPKINIPIFSGKYSEWANFRDLYQSLIHRRSEIPNVLKLTFLRTYCTEDALEKISSITVSEANYAQAWKALLDYYENKRRLVNIHLTELFAVKPMSGKTETAQELNRLNKGISKPLKSLKQIQRKTDEWGDIVVFLTVTRFHCDTRKEWEKRLGSTTEPPTVDQLQEFISTHLITLESIEAGSSTHVSANETPQQRKTPKPNSQNQATSDSSIYSLQTNEKKPQSNKSPNKCYFCNNNHYIAACDAFKAKSVQERKSFVIDKHLCFNCLGKHSVKDCPSQKTCAKCHHKHHTHLHISRNEQSNRSAQSNTEPQTKNSSPSPLNSSTSNASERSQQADASTSTVAHSTEVSSVGRGVLLATAKIKVMGPSGIEATIRALVDPCSQASFISESLCQRLRLDRKTVHVPISGVGEKSSVVCKAVTQFLIKPRFESTFTCDVEALVIPRVSAYTPPTMQSVTQLPHLNGLVLADPDFMRNYHIDVLLGASTYALIIEGDIRKGKPNEPIATLSLLGWLLSGDTASLPRDRVFLDSVSACHCAEEQQLNEFVLGFIEQESIPKQTLYTPEEQACEDFFVQTHRRNSEGRYIVRLPFKNPVSDQEIKQCNSYIPAVRALQRMENRFTKDETLRQAYTDFMAEYLSLGHMILASKASVRKDNSESIFLPHHGVWKESSTTTKLRTVFNGSYSSFSRISLNKLLHVGPNLLPILSDLICQWRMYKVVFSSDSKMHYRQILLNELDQHLQSIVWRSSPNMPIETYRLTTVTYGLAPSAYLASRVMKQLAIDGRSDFPLGSQVLENQLYMDDVLSGAHSVEEAITKQKETIGLAKSGGFPLRKWSSNDVRLLNWLPQDMLAVDKLSFFDKRAAIAVLGLTWNPQFDEFRFQIDHSPIIGAITKRTLLSRIARLFDPMGWLAPVVIIPKILMQSIWLLKVDWDAPLPQEVLARWEKWYKQISHLSDISIPRWSNYSPSADVVEIHGYADASSKAYGAVVYLRVIKGKEVSVSMQIAKTRVAPINGRLTIPLLELCAAQLLARLVSHYSKAINIEVTSTHLWTDALDVLYWLSDNPAKWKVFVANRCAEIHKIVPTAFWHHVSTDQNPADLASRGVEPSKFLDSHLWWHGPSALTESNEAWIQAHEELSRFSRGDAARTHLTALQTSCHETQVDLPWDLIDRYSSFNKLIRITAYCMRFIVKLKIRCKSAIKLSFLELECLEFSNYDQICNPLPSNQELENSRLLWVFWVQHSSFAKEIEILNKGDLLSKKNRLIKLKPILVQGLLRVGGRLTHANLHDDSKHPLILPSDNRFAELLIRHTHFLTLHGGTQLTLCTLRQQYWLICARRSVKAVIHKCSSCIRYAAPPTNQLMGDLPQARVTPSPAFQRAGVDYAGPVRVRLSKCRGNITTKGYIAIFVCMSTRAVHIELVEDLTAEAFIAAFHRFTARKGMCSDLYSDQGTNFVGADSELRDLLEQASASQPQILYTLSKDGTQWHFNPPGAPHQGGLWEAAVKSTKHHLRRVIGDQVLTFVELYTILCRVEACLNSRPLIALSDDPTDLDPLTPAHILFQRSSVLVPEPDRQEERIPAGKRWELASQMLQNFWSRWSNEYLSSLQQRGKWFQPTRSIQEGDLVLVRGEQTPPAKWPLARVIQTHPGDDGHVRVVTLRTSTSTFQRPVVKLVLLLPK